MPTVALFHGVAIRMYIRDHPPPHFHAISGDHEALIQEWTPRGESNCATIGAVPVQVNH